MKIILTLVVLLLICSSVVQGEMLKGFGFKTGLAIANQSFDYTVPVFGLDMKNRIGFDFGGIVEWFNLPYLSVLTEAHYIQKGMKSEVEKVSYSHGGEIGTITYDYRVDYLSVSALVKFTLEGKLISPYLITGPRFDFLLGNNTDGNDELYDNFKSTVLGGDVGIGAEFDVVDLGTILSEFRYSYDFSKAYKNDFLQVKNRSFQILLGFRL